MGNWFHELGLFLFAVLAHWQALVTGGIVMAAVVFYETHKGKKLSRQSMIFIISAFALYSMFAAWQDEHRNTKAVVEEKSILSSNSNLCASELKATQGTLRDKESVADTFQKAILAMQPLAQQQEANLQTCNNQFHEMTPRLSKDQRVIVSRVWGQPNPPFYLFSLVLVTGKPEVGNGVVSCIQPFEWVQPINAQPIPGSREIPAPNKPVKISDHAISIHPGSFTQWSPLSPIILTVKNKDGELDGCTFKLD